MTLNRSSLGLNYLVPYHTGSYTVKYVVCSFYISIKELKTFRQEKAINCVVRRLTSTHSSI